MDKIQKKQTFQWFIITAIGGKEDSIVENLKEKLNNFGYSDYVKDICVFKTKIIKEETFKKDDPSLPKNLRNTKTITWEVLPNGLFKKTSTRIVNKFPGYVFINMSMDPQVWYCIRNTNGVLGFVGSTGKGALPIPISMEEYRRAACLVDTTSNVVSEGDDGTTSVVTTTDTSSTQTTNVQRIYECPFKVGNTVQITAGAFEGENGEIISLDNIHGNAIVQIEIMGRATNIQLPYDQLKAAD